MADGGKQHAHVRTYIYNSLLFSAARNMLFAKLISRLIAYVCGVSQSKIIRSFPQRWNIYEQTSFVFILEK